MFNQYQKNRIIQLFMIVDTTTSQSILETLFDVAQNTDKMDVMLKGYLEKYQTSIETFTNTSSNYIEEYKKHPTWETFLLDAFKAMTQANVLHIHRAMLYTYLCMWYEDKLNDK